MLIPIIVSKEELDAINESVYLGISSMTWGYFLKYCIFWFMGSGFTFWMWISQIWLKGSLIMAIVGGIFIGLILLMIWDLFIIDVCWNKIKDKKNNI